MTDEQLDVVTKALRRAWSLGQTYWSQADSESYSQNRRADETQLAFQRLVEDTRAALASDHALACTASNDSMAVSAAPQAEPKREPTGAPYGIIDPDYGRVYTIARKLAWEEGYAIGLHGSFTRDLDLIAVPWAERACEAEHLIRRIADATGLKLRDGVGVKPHGRRAWTLLFPAFGDPRFVDLSVMPRIGGSDAE